MDHTIDATDHGNNVVDGLNATDKRDQKQQMELIGKLSNNDTSNIVIIPSAQKYVSIKYAYQCIHILNNKDRLNGLKGITRNQKRESLFKYK